MNDEVKTIPSEKFHVGEFIEEELQAREWSRDELARRMGDDYDKNRLLVDLIMDVRDVRMNLDSETAGKLAVAFGVSPQFFINLHEQWRASSA